MSIVTPDDTEAALLSTTGETADTSGVEEEEPRISTPLRVAIGSSFILRLAGASTGFMLAAYLKQVVKAEPNLIGLLAAVFYATELLLAPVFGALSDLRGRKLFLVLGPLAGAVAVQIHPLTTIVGIIAIGRLMEGIATAANTPGALGYLADATSGKGPKSASFRGRVMGFYEMSFLVGLVGGNLLGGQLWNLFEANGFRLISVVYLAAAAMLFLFVPESLPAAAREHHVASRQAAQESEHPVRALITSRLKAYGDLLKEPALRSFVPAWLAINAIAGLWFTHVAPLMIKGKTGSGPRIVDNQLLDGHLTPEQVSFALGGFGFVFMVGIFLWSRRYGRMRRSNMMLASICGVFVVAISLFGINNNVIPPNPLGQWWLVPILIVGVLMESGFTPVALAYLADISETRLEHRGAVMGLYSVFLGIGQFVGGSTGGLFIGRPLELGFNGLLLATVILGVIAGATVIHLRSKYDI